MLKNRSMIILAVVLAALVAISLIQSISHKRATSHSDKTPLLTGNITADDLSRIEIGYGQEREAVVLEKLPDGWVVRTAYSYPANQNRVDTLLQSLSDLQGEFRSESAAVLPDYGFTDSTSVCIRGYVTGTTDPLLSLDIGKKPDRSVGNFVKQPGSSAVYLTSKSILSALGLYSGPALPQSKHFLELEAHRCDRLDVDAITLYDGDSVIAMVKEFAEPEPSPDDTTGALPEIDRKVYEWKLIRPQRKSALKTKADGVLGAVSTIRAQDISDPDTDLASYGLADSHQRVEIIMQDGTQTTLVFGHPREADETVQAGVYMQVGGDESVWVVSEYLIKNIFKSYDELLPEEE